MWALDNQTSFAAERAGARDRDGGELWLVAVKATYVIGPGGQLALLPEQKPVDLVPRYRGEPGASSLLSECDLTYPKPATDVILDGSAWAPGGGRASFVDVGAKVGPITKTLRVFGDRRWDRNFS